MVLSNTLPVATNFSLSQIVQIANGNGYTTGGTVAPLVSSGQTSGVYKLVLDDVVFTATGNMATFQYAVLYDDTSASDRLIGWWDYGSPISMIAAETFTVDFSASDGVLQIA